MVRGTTTTATRQRRCHDARRLRSRLPRWLIEGSALHIWVRGKLEQLRWSPEQIAGRLRAMHPDDPDQRVCHETIYAAIIVDGEQMHLMVGDGHAGMKYAQCPDPDLVLSTGYSDLLALSEGENTLAEFAREHSKLQVNSPGKEDEFLTLMSAIVALLSE